jgi:lysyl-tRNA synthetase class 2
VRDFPPSQAALARLNAAGWADRLELYWNGLEIANGFNELTDAATQRARFVAELGERQALGRSPVPLDEDFLQALKAGIPPTAGMAVGLERLFMARKGIRDIGELKVFPY